MPRQTDVTTHAETVALFRYGLIADLRDLRPGDRALHARLDEKAAREYEIPGDDAPPRRARHVARLALCLSPRRLRRAQAAPAPGRGPRPRAAASGGRRAVHAEGRGADLQRADADRHRPPARADPRRPRRRAGHRASPAHAPWPHGARRGDADDQGPPALRVCARQRPLDERRDARAECAGGGPGGDTRRI